ncbi:hypothetical protein [Arenibacter sp. S6351L]|uniref:hypothetical protein n=1 Tax=Arenibacter sp. S6351L TaxID=2926407 RepID=UPI001FF15C96|nr:hypothetical protein [Arenibacter sp. S6351L]MCK0136178.1 hypothetical protein [Arenibacter sp. S6351L]
MQDYWKKFDILCSDLKADGKQTLIDELRKAQSYVNGLTDGWYDFLNAFEKALKTHKLEGKTQQLAIELIETLKNRLEKG